MKIEEYQTIRQEMLQRFKRTHELLIFSISATGVLLSWLATQSRNNSLASSFVFSAVGLGIVLYVFYLFRVTLRQIYHQGGYLAVFHELDSNDLKYHLFTRFFDYLKPAESNKEIKSKWGQDGRTAAVILVLLTIANLVGPWFLLNESITVDSLITIRNGFPLAVTIFLLVLIVLEVYRLWTTKEYMEKNLNQWIQIRNDYLKNPKTLQQKVFQTLKIEEKKK